MPDKAKNPQSKGKRELLLEAAAAKFREYGFEKTSIAQIVRKAGVAHGTFYLYFESKAQLVPALAQSIIDEMLGRLQAYPTESLRTAERLVEALIRVTYAVTEEQQELISFCYSGMAYYQWASQWEAIYAPYYTWLEEQLYHLRRSGDLESESDLTYTANFVVGVLEQGAENFFVFGADPQHLERSKHELKRFLLRALES